VTGNFTLSLSFKSIFLKYIKIIFFYFIKIIFKNNIDHKHIKKLFFNKKINIYKTRSETVPKTVFFW